MIIRLLLLLVYLSLAFTGLSQDEIALADGQLFVNKKKIGLTTNKVKLDMAMGSKGKYALLIKPMTQIPGWLMTQSSIQLPIKIRL